MIGFWCHPSAGQGTEIDEHACSLPDPPGDGTPLPSRQNINGEKS